MHDQCSGVQGGRGEEVGGCKLYVPSPSPPPTVVSVGAVPMIEAVLSAGFQGVPSVTVEQGGDPTLTDADCRQCDFLRWRMVEGGLVRKGREVMWGRFRARLDAFVLSRSAPRSNDGADSACSTAIFRTWVSAREDRPWTDPWGWNHENVKCYIVNGWNIG